MKVVHVIDSIGIGGGAEKIVADTISGMKGVSHTLVTLYAYAEEYSLPDTTARQTVNCTSLFSLPVSLFRLWKILRSENADVIHAHLFWSALLCKIIRPRGVSLLVTAHSMWGTEVFQRNRLLLWLEKRLAHRQHALAAVSHAALQDYLHHIPYRGRTYTLHNFVSDVFFEHPQPSTMMLHRPVRCIAVGHFKPAKDFIYLIQCFFLLQQEPFVLDIYGQGPLQTEMQQFIDHHHLANVRLQGLNANMHTVFPQYDVFLSLSLHEGYGLALAEAMASALPCIVSDIPAHREVGDDACIYIKKGEGELKKALLQLVHDPAAAGGLAARARNRATATADKQTNITAVKQVYDSLRSV